MKEPGGFPSCTGPVGEGVVVKVIVEGELMNRESKLFCYKICFC